MSSHMILPVTRPLKLAMVAAKREMDHLAAEQSYRINDRKHFEPIATVLNGLVLSLMAAPSATNFITARRTIGARFDMGPDTQLSRTVDTAIGFLRNTASEVLSDAMNQSTTQAKHTEAAERLLCTLYGQLTGAIMYAARNDLAAVLDIGPGQLVAAAEYLYGIAHPKPVDASKEEPGAQVPQQWNPAG